MKRLLQFYISLLLLSTIACTAEKDNLIADFDRLHQEIKNNNYTGIQQYMDAASSQYIDQMSNLENLTPSNLKKLGKENGLSYFNALYYSQNIEKIKRGHEQPVFSHLAKSDTPLFSIQSEYEHVAEKSRIGKEPYICIGRMNNAGQRVISWLPYTKEGEAYKLNLIGLLKNQEKVTKKYVRQLTSVSGQTAQNEETAAIDNLYAHPFPYEE